MSVLSGLSQQVGLGLGQTELPILLIPDSIISKNYFQDIPIISKDAFFSEYGTHTHIIKYQYNYYY